MKAAGAVRGDRGRGAQHAGGRERRRLALARAGERGDGDGRGRGRGDEGEGHAPAPAWPGAAGRREHGGDLLVGGGLVAQRGEELVHRSISCRSASRPRESRERTVPVRQPSALAIAASGRSWT